VRRSESERREGVGCVTGAELKVQGKGRCPGVCRASVWKRVGESRPGTARMWGPTDPRLGFTWFECRYSRSMLARRTDRAIEEGVQIKYALRRHSDLSIESCRTVGMPIVGIGTRPGRTFLKHTPGEDSKTPVISEQSPCGHLNWVAVTPS
jgi:hypothetical protein